MNEGNLNGIVIGELGPLVESVTRAKQLYYAQKVEQFLILHLKILNT